ncbi:MAG: phosphotransferase [Lapillicoccus sp.]
MEGWTPRPSFGSLPREVVRRVEERLGSAVTGHRDATGGMSPAVAAVLLLANGRRVFVKVLQRGLNTTSEVLVEREWRALALLPETIPYARPLATEDLGGWLLTAVEGVDGTTVPTPWSEGDLGKVLTAYATIGAHRAPEGLPTTVEVGPRLDGWDVLVGDPARREAAGVSAHRSTELAGFVGDWRALLAGDRLVHADARADNVLISRAQEVVVVDWSFGSRGPAWVDVAQVCLDALTEGSSGAQRLAVETVVAAGWPARRYAVGLVGMLTRNATNPPHAGLPTFRAWQQRRAQSLWPFLAELVGA